MTRMTTAHREANPTERTARDQELAPEELRAIAGGAPNNPEAHLDSQPSREETQIRIQAQYVEFRS